MTTRSGKHLAVLGAGVMGVGITTTALAHGLPVVLVDVDRAALDRARTEVAHQLRHAALMGAAPADRAPGEVVTTTSVRDAAGAVAVVEAVTERLDAKVGALGAVADVVDPGTPLITNTSGIPVDVLADAVPRPGELVGAHFMNPAYLIDLVEVVRGPRTADDAVARLEALLGSLGRRAVVVRDSPGFVTSRLLHPLLNDAARLVGEGVATAEQVDDLMRGCLGHRTGPLRTADLIGLDNLVDSLAALHERTGVESYRPGEALLEKVRQGHLGRKSGRGFYDYGESRS
ncbi:3-hydroxyacyl-CoA dehydrogenase family protein [Saccharothrix xinjiangensis]|uniref:3-hydroxyacyl-CoA dehydrogenase family protein n=1 Tax=Saccharothrix xinjiangensis TaxID=204798 RepID=A0ABV9Y1T0_9PSEU